MDNSSQTTKIFIKNWEVNNEIVTQKYLHKQVR